MQAIETVEPQAVETPRKLASVQRVASVGPIPDADFIELASALGWQFLVVKKGELKPGDLAVLIEPDGSVVPEKPCFEFMRPRKFRVKTARLRKQLSQGLLMPMPALAIDYPEIDFAGLEEGQDVTALLGVTLYERPDVGANLARRDSFLALVPRTDEIRIQSAPAMLDELHGKPYVITVKLDGRSGTFGFHHSTGEFHACSRNQSVKDEAEGRMYWEVARRYQIEEQTAANKHLAIQFELCGPGIAGNPLKLDKPTPYVFSVYDTQAGRYLDHFQMQMMAEALGLPLVPTLEIGKEFGYSLDQLLALAEGTYNSGAEREGVVIRPLTETPSELGHGGRLSFKVISNRFLLGGK